MKKEYKKPELKEVKLKQRTSLLQGSVTGELGYNETFENMTSPKA